MAVTAVSPNSLNIAEGWGRASSLPPAEALPNVRPTPHNTSPPSYNAPHLITTGLSDAPLDVLQRERAKV